jgi:hypothetical protein
VVLENTELTCVDDILEDKVEELKEEELLMSWEESEQQKLRVLTA